MPPPTPQQGPGEAGSPRAVAVQECGLLPLGTEEFRQDPLLLGWEREGSRLPPPPTATSEPSPVPAPLPSFPSRKPSWPISSGSAWLASPQCPWRHPVVRAHQG